MSAGTPTPPPGFTLDSKSGSAPPPPPGFTLDAPGATPAPTTPPGSLGGTGKPLNITPIKDAFPGQTLQINLMRRQPEMLPKFLAEKGYKQLPNEGAEGQALFRGPDGRVIDANEFLPASGMVIHGPPIALQTGAAMTSALTGPLAPATEFGIGGLASVGGDLYDAMLNKLYGLPSGLSVGGETRSFVMGGLAQSAPSAFEAATGVSAAKGTATSAMDIAQKESDELAAKKAEILAERDTKMKIIGKRTADEPGTKIQEQLQADRNKLGTQVGKGMEAAREPVAEAAGKQATEKMLGKTPEQLSAERAQTIDPIAQRRAAAQSPYFDAAHELHEEVGKKFDPYINPIKKNVVDQVHLDGLTAKIDSIEQWGLQNGQRVDDPTLNRIFDRVKDVGKQSQLLPDATGDPVQALINQRTLESEAFERPKPLTYGELWGYRAQANKVLATSRNPGIRKAAHEIVDGITEMMPNVPQAIKDQYATSRAWFSPSMTGRVARAQAPQQVGEAIWGAPVEVQQEIIRRASKSPEAMDGLRLSFADNFLGNKMKPDDLAKFDPKVIRNLYGSDAGPIMKLLGPEGKIKSASWEALIQHDPKARDAFDTAFRQVMQTDEVQATQKAIRDGQALLRDMPDQAVAKRIQAHVDATKLPADKLRILQTEMPDPAKAGAEALRNMKPGRMESIIGRRGAWIALGASLGGYRYILRNPAGLALLGTGVGLLGGRAALRYALTKPGVAELFVDALSHPANYQNAAMMGRFIAGVSEGSMLQYGKEQGFGEFAIPGSVPQRPTESAPTP
jgi:hypothetical protein